MSSIGKLGISSDTQATKRLESIPGIHSRYKDCRYLQFLCVFIRVTFDHITTSYISISADIRSYCVELLLSVIKMRVPQRLETWKMKVDIRNITECETLTKGHGILPICPKAHKIFSIVMLFFSRANTKG